MELRRILVTEEASPEGAAARAIARGLARARDCELRGIGALDDSEVIADSARAWNADLIVLGAPEIDTGGAGDTLATADTLDTPDAPPGTTPLAVCLASPCPVLVTRPGHERFAPRSWGFRRPVVAVDYSPLSEPAARIATSLAERDGAVDLLHVFFPHPPGEGLSPGLERPWAGPAVDEARARELRRLFAFSDRVDTPAVAVECHVEIGHAAHQIVEHVGRQENDLVVLGAHGRGNELQRALGTVTDRVLRHAPVPLVLIAQRLAALR